MGGKTDRLYFMDPDGGRFRDEKYAWFDKRGPLLLCHYSGRTAPRE